MCNKHYSNKSYDRRIIHTEYVLCYHMYNSTVDFNELFYQTSFVENVSDDIPL